MRHGTSIVWGRVKRHAAFGLLVGEGANINDCGNMFTSLDAAGVPIFAKGQSTARGIYDIQQLREQSGMPHVTVFRQDGIHSYDRPDYALTPVEAAQAHWQLTKWRIPPELKPEWTWVEPINEVAKWFEYGDESEINWPHFAGQPYERKFWEGQDEQGNRKVYLDNANWLGWFSVEIAHLMMADGYKQIAFSWNTGEPEAWQWETAGVLAYLRLCEQFPDDLGVGIHEYSGVLDGLLMRKSADGGREPVGVDDVERQNIVGRFQNTLVATCRKHNIAIPKFCVTEGGWTHTSVPSADVAIAHMRDAARLYFQYEQCLGFAIWGSVPGYGNIDHEVQRMIWQNNRSPLGEMILSIEIDVVDSSTHPPVEEPVNMGNELLIDTTDGVLLHIPAQHQLSQRDPRWANIDLDGRVGGRTIGQWGCLGVAYNMLARCWGLTELLPGQFLQQMRNSGAMSGEAVRAGALKTMYADSVIYDGYIFRQSPHMRKRLRDFLDAGIPVIGRVDFNPSTAQIDQHWVLIVGENGRDELLCIDPWTGKLENINRKYGIAGSDVVEILLYRPTWVQFPKGDGNQDNNGGTMPMQPRLRDFPLIIDVSEFRPNVPMDNLNAQGIYGVRLRISTGLRLDREFHQNMARILSALRKGQELAVTGYHDLDPRFDIGQQADIFQIGLSHYDVWSGGWAFSVEPTENRRTPNNEEVGRFIQAVHNRIGRRAYEMYSRRDIIDENIIDHHDALLWIAAYYSGDFDPLLPQVFDDWHVHQFTDSFPIDGYPLGVDCSYFNGTRADLRHYARTGWLVIDPVVPPAPAEIVHDLWHAMTQAPRKPYMVLNSDGNKERYQNFVVANGTELFKTKYGNWEHYRLDTIEIDGEVVEVIRLVKDTSPENHGNIDSHYEVVGADGKPGGIWAKRWMAVGETFIEPGTHRVTFYDSANGAEYGDPRSGVNRNVCTLVAADALGNLVFGNPAPDGEMHHTTDGYGVTGWVAPWGSAALHADDAGAWVNRPKTITLGNGQRFTPSV